MYDPHKEPDIRGEMEVMARGRLVKARLADQPAPNVSWFWIPLGNCHVCRYLGAAGTACLNPKIDRLDFLGVYMRTNDCPEFEVGVDEGEAGAESTRQDVLDVMRAVGLVPGEPSQRVVVIRDVPWSVDAAIRAHSEQSTFLHLAHASDLMAQRGTANDPNWLEYADFDDDLEGAASGAGKNPGPPSPQPPPPGP